MPGDESGADPWAVPGSVPRPAQRDPYGPPPGYGGPPQYGPPPGYGGPPPGYGGPPQYGPPPGYGWPPAYLPPQGWSPYGQQPWYSSGPPPQRREPAGWLYAIPALLVVGAVVALTVFFVSRADEIAVAAQSEKVGRTDTGVGVRTLPGWSFDVYLPDTGDEPTLDSCTFHTDTAGDLAVDLDESTNGDDYYTDDRNRDWYQVGTVVAPAGANGRARLTCAGFSGPMDIYPDDSMFGWMFLVIALSGLSVLVGVAVLVLLLVLRGRARGSRPPSAPAAPGYGYTAW